MTDPPLFSVIVPTHNYGRYLPTAINSVLDQNQRSIEILVIDDASTDQTPAIVAQYGDLVTYRRLEENVGPAAAWAIGLDQARGRYVTKLDADDWYLPRHLEAISEAFGSNPKAGMVISPVCIYHQDDGRTEVSSISVPSGFNPAAEFRERLLRRFFFHIPGVALRRDAIVGHEGPRTALWMAHDWEYLIRTMSGWACVVLDEPTAVYRVHGTSVTRSRDRADRRRADLIHLLQLAEDPTRPLVSSRREKSTLALGLAETYLRVTPFRESVPPIWGPLGDIKFAWSLALRGRAPFGFARVLARVGWIKARSRLGLRGRRGRPIDELLPTSIEPPRAEGRDE